MYINSKTNLIGFCVSLQSNPFKIINISPSSHKIFRGRPNISVDQPILVNQNITQNKHVIVH